MGAPLATAPTRVGRYELFDVFASGGMASVHLGRLQGPVGFARVVAVKRMHPHLASRADVTKMLVDEARVASRIRHLNVVPTLDVIAEDGEFLVVMEYVHGVSLSTLLVSALERRTSCPPPVAIAIVRDVLRGLHAAHEARDEEGRPLEIVHRDVSPQNVLVGTDGVTRVVDFGVAKARNRMQESTREGELKGKLSYMAPEQLKGATATRRADIYGAGVVLWEALTGTRLFSGDNEAATWLRVLNEMPAPPSSRTAGVPRALDAIVLRALSKLPERRDATAQEMADRLEACGAIATPAEVGAWVRSIAEGELARRERMVSTVERTPPPAEPPPPEELPARRNWMPAVGALVVAGFLLSVLASRASSPDPLLIVPAAADPAPAEPRLATLPPERAAAPEPGPETAGTRAEPEPEPEPEPIVIDIDPPASKGKKVRRQRPVKRDCDPPWNTDVNGRKVYKEQCL